MARDELVELLAQVRHGVSLDELRECIPQIHKELAEISRKRSHFLEDACATVLRQSFGSPRVSSRDSESEGDDDSPVEAGEAGRTLAAVAVCMAFAEPLIHALPPRTASEDMDLTRQRGVLVAFVLAILSRAELAPEEGGRDPLQHSCETLAALTISVGIDLHTITWALRVREELHMFRSMMLPRKAAEDDDSDDDFDQEADGKDSNDGEDDDAWMIHTVATAAGFDGVLEYFLKESGHEYAFVSWSPVGIVRLVVLIVAPSAGLLGSAKPVSMSSPYSTLFALAAVAQALLQAQSIQTKRQGLVVLKHALDKCTPGGLAIGDPSTEVAESKTRSFEEAAAAFRIRDWITPLIELASNAMVSFPDADDRAMGLTTFRQLLQVVELDHRFWLTRRLALRCPYGNVAAIFIDQLRNDTFRVWSSPALVLESTPYTSSALTILIVDFLKLLVERDLKTHADLLASVASLIRFVAIRDKENHTNLRAPETLEAVKVRLDRLHSRLRSTMAEAGPSIPASDPSNMHALLHDENARFVLVEAALQSTIDLLSS